MIAAGIILLVLAAALRTRLFRLWLALLLLMAGNVLIAAADRAMEPRQ